MKSKEYIKAGLIDLLKRYPQLTFFYQFDERANLHQVHVEPQNEFKSNQAFRHEEADFIYEFDNLFFPESIVFISEDSLIKISSPEYILYNPSVQKISLEYNFDFQDKSYRSGENNYALAA